MMIHTYYMDVTQFEDKTLFQEKLKFLSPCRRHKIAQLQQEKDKWRSLGAGLALDHALKIYGNGLREQDMEYVFGEWGKPSFQNYPEIHFSLSHSGNYAVCSIGESPVGNDIERIRPGRLKVADRFFTAPEREFLYGKDPVCAAGGQGHKSENREEITQRMFRIWTMKESFLKVTGRGMTLPLQDFSVIVDGETKVVDGKQRFDDVTYYMREYDEIPGYRMAVCCRAGVETADHPERILS